MKVIEEINTLVKKAQCCKQAGFMDWYVNWRANKFRAESDAYRKSLGMKPFSEMNPIADYYAKKQNNEAIRAAQSVSDKYKYNSLAKTKTYHGGNLVAE